MPKTKTPPKASKRTRLESVDAAATDVGFHLLSPSSKKIVKGSDGRWHVNQSPSSTKPTAAGLSPAAKHLLKLAQSPSRTRVRYFAGGMVTSSNVVTTSDSHNADLVSTSSASAIRNLFSNEGAPNSCSSAKMTTKKLPCVDTNRSDGMSKVLNKPTSSIKSKKTSPDRCNLDDDDIVIVCNKTRKNNRKRTKAQRQNDGLEAMWLPDHAKCQLAAARAYTESLKCGFRMHQDKQRQFVHVLNHVKEMPVEQAFPALVSVLTSTEDGSAPMWQFAQLLSLFVSDADALKFGCYHQKQSIAHAWDALIKMQRYITSARARQSGTTLLRSLMTLCDGTNIAEDDVISRISEVFPTDAQLLLELRSLFPNESIDSYDCPPESCFETITSDDLASFSSCRQQVPDFTDHSSAVIDHPEFESHDVKRARETMTRLQNFEHVRFDTSSKRVFAGPKSTCNCVCHRVNTLKCEDGVAKGNAISTVTAPMTQQHGEHCNACRIKFSNGSVYLLQPSTNRWVPAVVSYPNRDAHNSALTSTQPTTTDAQSSLADHLVSSESPVVCDQPISSTTTSATTELTDVSQLPGLLTGNLIPRIEGVDESSQLRALLDEMDDDTIVLSTANKSSTNWTTSCVAQSAVGIPGSSGSDQLQVSNRSPKTEIPVVWSKDEDAILLDALSHPQVDDVRDALNMCLNRVIGKEPDQITARLRFIIAQLEASSGDEK